MSTDTAIYNIPRHRRGDTWDGILALGFKENGIPVNLSGAVVSMELREDYDAPVALTFTTNDSSILIQNSLSSINIAPRIIDIPPATYLYDIQVVYPTMRVKTYLQGSWEIYFDITK